MTRILAACRRLLACAMALMFFFAADLAGAQTPLAPDLGVTIDGTVLTVVRQADGSVLFGGEFAAVNGQTRWNLARLRPDGSLDPDWAPTTNGFINALAVDAGGAVYVGGAFFAVNGQPRSNLAKISAGSTGALDVAWVPEPDGPVYALAVDAAGAIYVGGIFNQIAGVPRQNIAKLSTSGSAAAIADWHPTANGVVTAFALESSGVLFIGGSFTDVDGQPRSRIAKLAASGAVDPSWNPGADNSVYVLVLDGNGALFVGGAFANVAQQPRSRLAKLSTATTGVLDAAWNPGASSSVMTLLPDGAGNLYVGGFFTTLGGAPRLRAGRVSATTGAIDPNWAPAFDRAVYGLAFNGTAGLAVGGYFKSVSAQTHVGMVVLAADASPAVTISLRKPGWVYALARDSSGGLLVGGDFNTIGGIDRRNLARVRPDGQLDFAWNPAPNKPVYTLLVHSGSVFVGGEFSVIGGQSRIRLAKLSAAGVTDPDWDPVANSSVWDLAAEGDSLFVTGNFTFIDGQPRRRLAKLSLTGAGTIDLGWNPAPDGDAYYVAGDGQGSVYVAGPYANLGGQPRAGLAKLPGTGNGAADAAWNPMQPGGQVFALLPDRDGSLYVLGEFTSIGGQSRNRLAKLSGSGSGAADPNWNPDPNWTIQAIGAGAGNSLYVAGSFSSIGGQVRAGIARLDRHGSGAADPLWEPYGYGVNKIAVLDRAVYVGGNFTAISGVPRASLAALPLPDTIFDYGFDP